MRNGSARGICFIFADCSECLLSPIIAKNGHRATKTYLCGISRIEDDAGGGTPRVPISQIARSGSHRGTVKCCLRAGIGHPRGSKRRIYLGHSFLRNVVRTLGDVPVRQILQGALLIFLTEYGPFPRFVPTLVTNFCSTTSRLAARRNHAYA